MSKNLFNIGLSRYFAREDLEKIRKVKIGIAGAGGLGSNVAQMLTRSGFCEFVIADFDVVEISNLNRQFFFTDQVGRSKVDALTENLARINSKVLVQKQKVKITQDNVSKVFGFCDILIEALDKPSAKADFTAAALMLDKPVICASGLAGYGDSDHITITKRSECWYVVGDGISDIENGASPLAPRVMITAGKQADLVLKLVLDGEV